MNKSICTDCASAGAFRCCPAPDGTCDIKSKSQADAKRKTITAKEMRQRVKDFAERKPGREFAPGFIIKEVGTKYVTVLSLHGKTSKDKRDLEDFFFNHCASYDELAAVGRI